MSDNQAKKYISIHDIMTKENIEVSLRQALDSGDVKTSLNKATDEQNEMEFYKPTHFYVDITWDVANHNDLSGCKGAEIELMRVELACEVKEEEEANILDIGDILNLNFAMVNEDDIDVSHALILKAEHLPVSKDEIKDLLHEAMKLDLSWGDGVLRDSMIEQIANNDKYTAFRI